MNPATLELLALLVFVMAVVAGFRRIEQTLLVTALNERELHALEARGEIAAKLSEGNTFINKATGKFFNLQQAEARLAKLTKTIQDVQPLLDFAKTAAHSYYKRRNGFSLVAFVLLVGAKVWSAYI